MASAQKTPPKRAVSTKPNTQSSKKPTPQRKAAVPPQQPGVLWERIAGGAASFLLAMFLTLHAFGVKALVVDFLGLSIKGLFGYGFYLSIPALLLISYLFLFRSRTRITLRVWCAVLLPVLFGAFLHVFMDADLYQLSMSGLHQLWIDGQALHCGGMAGGFFAVLFAQLFSGIGASIIFLFGLLALCLGALHITPEAVLRMAREAYADYRASRKVDDWDDEYAYEEEQRTYESATSAASERDENVRRVALDLPVDEPPLLRKERQSAQAAFERPARRSFFNKASKVKRPDEVLAEISQLDEVLASAEPKNEPEMAVAQPAQPTVAEQVAPAAQAAQAAAPAPTVPVVPITVATQQVEEPEDRDLSKRERREMIREQQEAVAKDVAEVLEAAPSEYVYPSINLLHEAVIPSQGAVQEELSAIQKRLSETISSFGITAKITGAVRGPSITRYELELEQGVRLNKLTNLADDIALALGASSVRIAPVPGKISLVGIEVPNKKITPVPIREVIASENFTEHASKVAFTVGKDIGGNYIIGDIARLPHLLIAGTTGSGKSVCTNSLIISMLYKATPDEVRMIMIDPKMVELGIYNGIPHLLIPVVTDPKKAAGALQWAVVEMMKRYRIFSEIGVRDLASYNSYAARTEGVAKMPQIVVVIDELADLMLVAAKEVEESICRVAQMGRASGMHLIIATQRPSADVITGLMKANIPSRIAFAVASSLESRIILDTQGAEKLVGKGDMLWVPLGSGKPLRVQGCLIDDADVSAVVSFVKDGSETLYDEGVLQEIEQHVQEQGRGKSGGSSNSNADAFGETDDHDCDELFDDAAAIVIDLGQASVSMLQRRLKLGYSRAARLVDQMEDRGIVGPFEGSKPRQLLITREQWDVMQGKKSASAEAAAPVAAPPILPAQVAALSMQTELDKNLIEAQDWAQDDMPPWEDEEI